MKKLTYCNASDENISKNGCKHIEHKGTNETAEEFMNRLNKDMQEHVDENRKQELYSMSFDEKRKMIKNNQNLDVFIDDTDPLVRAEVANQGYGLDSLVNDEDYHVRCSVGEQGYGLNKLVNDESVWVRQIVAKKGYGLDRLVYDEDESVRVAVTYQGYGLDKLINDKDCLVRAVIAKQGYGLDKLANDDDEDIRKSVRHYLKENGLTLDEWKEKYPEKVVEK